MAVKPWKGAIVAPSKAPKSNPEKPSERLSIDWVYGYHGFTARNNLHLDASNNIVYHIAALGIVFDEAKHNQQYMTGHNDDIICLARNPANRNVFASGQV